VPVPSGPNSVPTKPPTRTRRSHSPGHPEAVLAEPRKQPDE